MGIIDQKNFLTLTSRVDIRRSQGTEMVKITMQVIHMCMCLTTMSKCNCKTNLEINKQGYIHGS